MNSYEQLRYKKSELKNKFGDNILRLDRLSTITLSDELFHQICECINSEEDIYVIEGFNFLKGVMIEKDVSLLPEWFVSNLEKVIRRLLDSKSKSLVYTALDWFIILRNNYPDYRKIMFSFLNSPSIGKRELALKHYDSFARDEEFKPLLSFENDDFACQIGHAGDWEYELRDKALLLAEKYSGIVSEKKKLCEPYEGARVYWLDWSNFKVKINSRS